MNTKLKDKFFGCIAGVHIGSAMGAAVEGMTWNEIENKHQMLEEFLPYEHYRNGWVREPGTTEDGVERQKLIITAIVEEEGRVNSEDVRKVWINHMNPKAGGLVSEPFESILYKMAISGIPARDLGKYCDYAGLNSFARACHPIGLINAGNIQTAKEDIMEVGQLYQTSNSRGLHWAVVTGVAIAAATKPDATVQSVLDSVLQNVDPILVAPELEKHLAGSRHCKNIRELRTYFDKYYNGIGMPYPFSYANEVVTKALCIFQMVEGNTREAIVAGVNMGRDTDCVAAVAAGISGALTGGSSIDKEWISQLDYATSINPHTNSKRTLAESSDSLFKAFEASLYKTDAYVKSMKGL